MRKSLYLFLAVTMTLFLTASCKEQSAQNKVDPKLVAATVDKALKTADTLDGMNLRAYELGQVGAAMAKGNVPGAAQTLDEALGIAREAHSETYKAVLAELKATTADWPATEHETIAPVIERIERATTRVWATTSVAGGIALLDKAKAKGVLAEAAAEADSIPFKASRDLDLRTISAQLTSIDMDAALAAAGRIADPRVKAWALTAIGTELAATKPDMAAKALNGAAEVAESITRMGPESELITSDTPAGVQEKVLSNEKAKLTAESARALARAALGLHGLDAARSADMMKKAADIASGIEQPYTKAYAMSDVAIDMASFDPQGAEELASKIDAGHEDAKFAAIMKAVKAMAAKSGAADQAELNKAAAVASSIEDPYDRAKALTEVGVSMAFVSKDAASQIAAQINYPELGNEVLAAVSVAAAHESDEQGKAALAKIVEPRFASSRVLYLKAKALSRMAAIKAMTDAAAAEKLYGKAASAAADAKSQRLQWEIVANLCKLDQDKLFDMAAKLEGGDSDKVRALSEIAAAWSAKGDVKSGMVWDMAAKTADGIDDKVKSCDLLRDVAAGCAQYDKTRAAAIFGKAALKAGSIGKV